MLKAVYELAKWEYKVIPIKTKVHSNHFKADAKPIIDNVQDYLNALGNEGWELVGVQDIRLPDSRMFTVAYLKRQNKRV
ncbi:MAG: DUF4177 domain-containing protein [Candidatus Bathyarchaeia archaeon]